MDRGRLAIETNRCRRIARAFPRVRAARRASESTVRQIVDSRPKECPGAGVPRTCGWADGSVQQQVTVTSNQWAMRRNPRPGLDRLRSCR